MSNPGTGNPPPGSSGGKLLLIVLLAAGLLPAVLCCGGAAGLAFWLRSAGTSLQQALADVRRGQPPAQQRPAWVNDWVVNQMLARTYTDALDAVAENTEVIAALGEPLEPGDEESLFRRQNTGELNPQMEAFEFSLKGPQGEAVVSVTAQARPPMNQFQATEIFVTLRDGRVIKVRSADPPEQTPVNEPESP